MGSHPCAVCCTVFSAIGLVLCTLFGFLFQQRNISLQVVATRAVPPWDTQKKAQSCFIAAGIYGVIFLLSMCTVIRRQRLNDVQGEVLRHTFVLDPRTLDHELISPDAKKNYDTMPQVT